MKVAVIGAGYAGLAIIYHILQRFPKVSLTIFDPAKIGENASGISTGLLHYFPGELARKSWNGNHCYQETHKLLQTAQKHCKENVFEETGLFRPAQTERQKNAFLERVTQYPNELSWYSTNEALYWGSIIPGMFIINATTVFSKNYIKGLWNYCKQQGVKWKKKEVKSLQEMHEFDQIILTAGYKSLELHDFNRPFQKIKGQALECKAEDFSLSVPLAGKAHITKAGTPSHYLLGSTYEKHFSSVDPDPEIALSTKETVSEYLPQAKEFDIIKTVSGVRLSQVGSYLPYVERIDKRTIFFGALGSRGLLYHAFFAKIALGLLWPTFDLSISHQGEIV